MKNGRKHQMLNAFQCCSFKCQIHFTSIDRFFHRPFPPNSARGKLAGMPLTDDQSVGVYVETVADWKLIKETQFLEQSWADDDICHQCFASKEPGPLHYQNMQNFRTMGNVNELNHVCK